MSARKTSKFIFKLACIHVQVFTHSLTFLPYSRLAILPSLLMGKSGRLYIRVVGWLVVCHGPDSSDVTLVFADSQAIQTLMDDE